MNERDKRMVDVIRALGEGEVTTYGDVAEVAGYPGRARLVGRLLAMGVAEGPDEIPWWRVVSASGRLAPGHESEQAELLTAEGVEVFSGCVRFALYGRFKRS